LPFAFCALPFDLLFGLERASQNANGPAGAGSKVKLAYSSICSVSALEEKQSRAPWIINPVSGQAVGQFEVVAASLPRHVAA
jgi:hypothetical protein